MIQEVEDESYAVLMVEREDDESFFEAHEPAVEEIGKATVVAMDLQDDNFETEDETYQVNMVTDEEMDHGCSKVLRTVDSGADISVLPEEFAGVGEEAHGGGRQIIMKDAGQHHPAERNEKGELRHDGQGRHPGEFRGEVHCGEGETPHPVCWASTTQWMGDEEKRRWPESLAQARS